MSLEQLNAARELVRTQPQEYPRVLGGILQLGGREEPEIRAWAAGFVADFFGSPDVSDHDKNSYIQEVLVQLPQWIEDVGNPPCVKLAICILCELYPRVLANTAAEGHSMKTFWDIVQVLKNIVLARWQPQTPTGIRVMCIKLAQVVISSHNTPLKHNGEVLDTVMLTAEAAGLLDRLISLFGAPTPVEFDELSATLNVSIAIALAFPTMAPRIVASALTFNVSQRIVATPSQLPLVLRWINKLFKLSLHPLQRHFPQIQVFLASLTSYCTSQALKRPAEESDEEETSESRKSASPAKRVKVDDELLPPGKQPYKSLYALSNDLVNVDARSLQLDLAVAIAVAGLQKVGSEELDKMIETIKKRLNSVSQSDPTAEAPFQQGPNQTQQQMQQDQDQQSQQQPQDVANEDEDDVNEEAPRGPSRAALEVEVPTEFKTYDSILNRLLTEAPVRVVARLSARGLGNGTSIKDFTQRKLYAQLVSDFRRSLEPLVLWLSEEYYADETKEVYFKLVARVVDEVIPKLEISDSRIFVRLLSELPELNRDIIYKIKSSCLDPERSVVGARALKFLIMFKPPCRKDCLDLVEELVQEGVQSVKGILEKYRPRAIEAQTTAPIETSS